MVGSWDFEGAIEMTEHWRSVVPDLSVELADDLTDVANDRRRVELVRQRYALELKHLGGRKRSGVSSLTRVSDWVAATAQDRHTPREGVPFALCRGVPSVLAEVDPDRALDGLDYAILVPVGPALLPRGPFLLAGVPLVIRCFSRNRPLPGNADALWPPERPVPAYAEPIWGPGRRRSLRGWEAGQRVELLPVSAVPTQPSGERLPTRGRVLRVRDCGNAAVVAQACARVRATAEVWLSARGMAGLGYLYGRSARFVGGAGARTA